MGSLLYWYCDVETYPLTPFPRRLRLFRRRIKMGEAGGGVIILFGGVVLMRNSLFFFVVSFCFLSAGTAWAQRDTISADFDGNGAVDFRDFSKLMAQFRQPAQAAIDPALDLNGDGEVNGEDAFVFADVFSDVSDEASEASEAFLETQTGKNTRAKLRLDPDGNGYLIYLEDIVRIGGYRIAFSLPEGVFVSKVHDLLGIGLLPVRETADGVEIVGLVLGNKLIEPHSELIAKVIFKGDAAGVEIESANLRGERYDLLNHIYIGERNEIASGNIDKGTLEDVAVSRRIFDFGHLTPGETVSDTFSIENTFDIQQVPPGTTRNLSFVLTTSGPEITTSPRSVGVLTDSTEGLGASRLSVINLTVTPMQRGVFSGYVDIETNRKERKNIRVHIMARGREGGKVGLTPVIADFDTNGTVDYGDFDQLITRFGQTLRLSKYDLDRDGVIDADDAFLFADVLGGGVGLAYLDRVDVVSGANGAAAVRMQGAGESLKIFARGLERLGGYRIVLKYNPADVDLRWARDRAGGGILPIHKTSTGAEIVGMGFGALVNTPGYLELAEIGVRPLKGQSDVQSLISIGDVTLRGSRGERDAIRATRIGANGLDAIPRQIDFGTVRLGATVRNSVRVFNLSDGPAGFVAASSDTTAMTNTPRTVGSLNPGRSWDVLVTYTATAVGPFSGALTITSNTDDPTPVVVQIRASVTDTVRVMPDSLAFGDVFVGRDSSQSITVTNPTADSLHISAIEFARSDSNFATDVALPLTIAGSDSAAIEVRFDPRVGGAIRDTLRIATGDGMYRIPLSGIGIQSLPRVDYDELDFGTVGQGEDSLLTVTVSNDGNIAQIISKVTVSGTGFALAPDPDLPDTALPDTLNAGDTHAIRVRFAPRASGDHAGTLQIALASETLEIGLSGTGRVSNPDFDGDGEVDFDDFVLFAQAFGTSSDDEQFDPRYDLDGDGEVGFGDFIAFAEKFGQRVG